MCRSWFKTTGIYTLFPHSKMRLLGYRVVGSGDSRGAFLTLLYEKFALAYAEGSNVPMVSLAKNVKNGMRWEWETIWRDFKHGVGRVFAAEVAKIRAMPAAEFPSVCYCYGPCAWVAVVRPNPDCGSEVVAEFNRKD